MQVMNYNYNAEKQKKPLSVHISLMTLQVPST